MDLSWAPELVPVHSALHPPCSSSNTRRSLSRACKFLPGRQKRGPWSKSRLERALWLAAASVSPGQLGTALRGVHSVVLGRSRTGPARLESPRADCGFADRATTPVPPRPTPDVCLKLTWAKFGSPFCHRAPAEGCFEVRWVYLTDVLLPTDHRKTSRA